MFLLQFELFFRAPFQSLVVSLVFWSMRCSDTLWPGVPSASRSSPSIAVRRRPPPLFITLRVPPEGMSDNAVSWSRIHDHFPFMIRRFSVFLSYWCRTRTAWNLDTLSYECSCLELLRRTWSAMFRVQWIRCTNWGTEGCSTLPSYTEIMWFFGQKLMIRVSNT